MMKTLNRTEFNNTTREIEEKRKRKGTVALERTIILENPALVNQSLLVCRNIAFFGQEHLKIPNLRF